MAPSLAWAHGGEKRGKKAESCGHTVIDFFSVFFACSVHFVEAREHVRKRSFTFLRNKRVLTSTGGGGGGGSPKARLHNSLPLMNIPQTSARTGR